jgi:hypothetical protein
MRIIYKDAEQAHLVPRQVMAASGPFGAYEPPRSEDDRDLSELYPPGATAQNRMQGIPRFVCRDCDEVLLQNQLAHHICEGES